MTKVKKRALSLLLMVAVLFSTVPQVPALAAKGVKQLADGISSIAVTESTILPDDNGIYIGGGDSALFGIKASFSNATASNAWATASNAEKASISNATSSNAKVATVEEIEEGNFVESPDLVEDHDFWVLVSFAKDAEPGSKADITVNVGNVNTKFTVGVPAKEEVVPVVTITPKDGKKEIEVGTTLQLEATASPANAVSGEIGWKSSNPNVATVNKDGLVSALNAGKTTISVTFGGIVYDGSKIDITVIPAKESDVLTESIQIYNKSGSHSNSAGIGESRELYAKSYPDNATNKKLIWSVSDESIASITVNEFGEAVVTGRKAGIVIIKASATDGSDVSASIDFEVFDVEKITKITLNDGKKIRVRVNKDRSIPITTEPREAVGLVQEWTSSNPDIFTTEPGWIQGISEGKATLSVTIMGVTETCEVEVWAQQLELALSRTKMDLQVGKETRINAFITMPDEGSVGMTQWKSSNPDVLEVVDGFDMGAIIKAKAVGKATLTATLDGKQATCEITVTKGAVAPTPADKIDAILDKNLEDLESGDPVKVEQAVTAIINSIQDTLKDVNAESMSADDTFAIANLEETLLAYAGGKFMSTDWDTTGGAEVGINEITGALLNLPTDWNTGEAIRAMLTVGAGNTEGIKLPTGVTGAQAFDITLDAVSGDRKEALNNLKVPIKIKMDVPEGLKAAKNLWIYNYHGNETIKIKPTISDGEMSFMVRKFSTFVIMDVPTGNNRSSSGGGSSYVKDLNVKGRWIQDSVGWWFEKTAGGYPKNEWAMINNAWYHFNEAGYMQTGWILLNNVWYYLNDSGAMISNQWFLYNGNWYYMNQSGAMVTNTTTPDGYRVDASGVWIK